MRGPAYSLLALSLLVPSLPPAVGSADTVLPAQALLPPAAPEREAREAGDAPPERGEYADTFLPLKPQVRDYERDPQNRYTYCIRSVAVYECLSYASDGAVRHNRLRVAAHGTGFAYREQGGETYLLTNQHVSEWPAVTDAAHKVDDVPAGCKRVSDTLKIVDNEDDDYGADDVPLARVVSDDALDAAVVKARGKLRTLPYHFGRSALLQTGDVVTIRGFPLGAFQAVNTGKVVNPYDRDQFGGWDHLDFIIDAPLSLGNSGSPVLAVSKRTGEYELVGMYHAGYTRATALNAVVGIDQLRDLMMTLRRPLRGRDGADAALPPGPAERAEFELLFSQPAFVPTLGLGPLLVGLRPVSGLLVYEVFSRRFPLEDRRLLVLVDRPAPGAFGTLGEVWFGNERGLKRYDPAAPEARIDGEVQGHVQAALRRLEAISVGTARYRAASDRAATSRDAVGERAALQRSLAREAGGDADLAQLLCELADRLSPRPSEPATAMPALLAGLRRAEGPGPGLPAVRPASAASAAASPRRVPGSARHR